MGVLWYPNPAGGGQWVSSPNASDVAVFTLTGQQLYWLQRSDSGRTQVKVPAGCVAGVYVLWQNGRAVRLTVQ